MQAKTPASTSPGPGMSGRYGGPASVSIGRVKRRRPNAHRGAPPVSGSELMARTKTEFATACIKRRRSPRLSARTAQQVAAPSIDECHVNLECRVVDAHGVNRHCFFVLEVRKAWIDRANKDRRTRHHRGMDAFMVAGPTIRLPSKMR
ncbi:MAG: flavin reductase [Rudaea sp.]